MTAIVINDYQYIKISRRVGNYHAEAVGSINQGMKLEKMPLPPGLLVISAAKMKLLEAYAALKF